MRPPHTPPAKCRRLTASCPSIPEDILVTEVLARLPVRSLFRFRSVCQSWRAAIDGDPRFVCRHLELSRGRSPPSVLDAPCEPRLEDYLGVARSKEMEFRRIRHGGVRHGGETAAAVDAELMHAVVWPTNRFTAMTHPVHCDGVVLVPTASGELFVCNPATRVLVQLPPGSPSVMADAVAFGFDPSSNTYKVARTFHRRFEVIEYDSESDDDGEGYPRAEFDIGHEVFTLGAGSSDWEPTEDPPHFIIPTARPICTRGAFYWTAVVGCPDDPRPSELLRFCLRDETFTVVSPTLRASRCRRASSASTSCLMGSLRQVALRPLKV
ncbi:putative F-box protein At3g24700 [Setaria italica]|nr:putative F-box protein At3g24700 [Setaria italica]